MKGQGGSSPLARASLTRVSTRSMLLIQCAGARPRVEPQRRGAFFVGQVHEVDPRLLNHARQLSGRQRHVDVLVTGGIHAGKGVLNFAPVEVKTPRPCIIHNVNISLELENLSYFVNHMETTGEVVQP